MNANSRVEGKKNWKRRRVGGRKVEIETIGGTWNFGRRGKGRQSGSTRAGVMDVPSWPPGATKRTGERGCTLYMNAIQLPRVDAWERRWLLSWLSVLWLWFICSFNRHLLVILFSNVRRARSLENRDNHPEGRCRCPDRRPCDQSDQNLQGRKRWLHQLSEERGEGLTVWRGKPCSFTCSKNSKL